MRSHGIHHLQCCINLTLTLQSLGEIQADQCIVRTQSVGSPQAQFSLIGMIIIEIGHTQAVMIISYIVINEDGGAVMIHGDAVVFALHIAFTQKRTHPVKTGGGIFG